MEHKQKSKDVTVQLYFSLPQTVPTLLVLQVPAHTQIQELISYLDEADRNTVQTMLDAGSAWSVFGKKKQVSHILLDGERVELCRSLIADPMSARRRRAKREHKSGKM